LIISSKRVAIVELLIGLAFLIVGVAVYWYARQLFWMMIYPPPIEKQILDVLPYVTWTIGAVLVLDSIKRFFRSRRKQEKVWRKKH